MVLISDRFEIGSYFSEIENFEIGSYKISQMRKCHYDDSSDQHYTAAGHSPGGHFPGKVNLFENSENLFEYFTGTLK